MSFDRLAPVYRPMEAVLAGDKLQRCRLTHLAKTQSARRALLLGEGHGRFIVPLLQSNSTVQVTCVDASAGMLEQTRQAMQRAGLSAERVQLVHADALSWEPAEPGFDLISTHFFLDCFTSAQLDQLVAKIKSLSAPKAHWLISDFCAPDQGLARIRARLILWSMYRFFRLATKLPASHLTDYTPILEQHGFQLEARAVYEWGLLRGDCWVGKG